MARDRVALSPRLANPILSLFLVAAMTSCGFWASYNDPLVPSSTVSLDEPIETIEPAAGPNPLKFCGFEYPDPGPHFVGLALSGGGARAAVFSAAVMFELGDLGILGRREQGDADAQEKVDVVSGASGGALSAAYYSLTCDGINEEDCKASKGGKRRTWDREDTLYDRLSREFLWRSLLWRLEPSHLFRVIFTSYDNTDILAAVLSDNLYDARTFGRDFEFEDMNPLRPLAIITATNATALSTIPLEDIDLEDVDPENEIEKNLTFTFTPWTFDELLNSDLCTFKVGRAVAASSAYPLVFNFSSLKEYKKTNDGVQDSGNYVHLFDAGASDNLAIQGLLQTMEHFLTSRPWQKFDRDRIKKATIFVVDAQNGFDIGDPTLDDPRTFPDQFVDFNFLDVYDTLMARNYGLTIGSLDNYLRDMGLETEDSRNVFHLPLKALDPNWKGYEGARRPEAFHAEARLPEATREEPLATHEEPLATHKQRLALLAAVNRIETSYGLEKREVHCLAASAYVLVNDLRPKLKKVFGRLPKVSDESQMRFGEDLHACISDE